MAHSPISRSDAFDPVGLNPVRDASGGDQGTELGTAQSQAQWVSTLTACGGGSLAADLALDLVLNDIGERARSATNSTAAAIALARKGEIVCRATTGENAPGLGVPLNTQSGLSAACVQSRDWQHCEDTELDERVDPGVCRRLGVRSSLVYPILQRQELLGIIEIFGSHPKAFSSREIGTLEALAREVVESVERAAAVPAASPATQSFPDVSLDSLQPEVPTVARKERDFWTDALSLLVIALAVILGWVVGRAGWRSTMTNSSARAKQLSQSSGIANVGASSAGSQLPDRSVGTPPADNGTNEAAVPESGLTVFRNGRVVFRAPAQSRSEDAAPGKPPVVARVNDVPATELRVPPEIANEYIVHRVEPEYPEEARAERIQGTVVIDAIVGKDGEVEKLTSIRGDTQLLVAATNAIRQWRFQPFFRNGQPEAFQTRISMDFRLP
jgi:TonB family protein